MDLDWCETEDLKNGVAFNQDSIIVSKEKKKVLENQNEFDENKNELNIENCFNQNFDSIDNKKLLTILNYLSLISNYLRTFIRNRSPKYIDSIEISEDEFINILKYLNWLLDSSNLIKKYFALPLRRDNSYDPNNIKLFKTSSYKFCNFKESCSIHKNKNKVCDKNHFVFEMIINDICKLIESVNTVGRNNLNWLLANKIIISTYDPESKKYTMNKANIANNCIDENQFIIDKTLIFKSFDVISYVLNKMYEEAYSFLNYDTESLLINI